LWRRVGRGFARPTEQAPCPSPVGLAALDPPYKTTPRLSKHGLVRVAIVQFHKEVEKLVAWLTGRESFQAAARIDSADGLLDHLWATSLQALPDSLFEAGRGEAAAEGSIRLRAWRPCAAADPARPARDRPG